MKSNLVLLAFAIAGMLLTGCLSRPPTINARHFVLAPISTNESAPAAAKHLSVGIGFVKMPSYLLRKTIVVRNGANEIQYIEDAMWAERLDQSFQRTLAANLSWLLPSDSIYLSDWGRDQVRVRVFINVQQFDVDTDGRGTLIVQWQIASPDSDTPLKSGQTSLARIGASPRGNPKIIAATLSELAGEFGRELALSIRESASSGP
jgi:uncharacterized lipoprotein YmbA